MKRMSIILILVLGLGNVQAQEWPQSIDETFPVATMNPLLALDADAVVRLSQQEFDIASTSKATYRVRRVVTILTAEGREEGELYIGYDKLRSLGKVEGRIRDAEGKVIRKLKKEDIEDYSAISGFSLYEDNRVTVAQLYHDTYPYTVEYTYEQTYNGLLFWPTWYPQKSGVGVEHSTFEILAPSNVPVRYAAYNTDIEPAVKQDGRKTSYRWAALFQLPFEREPWGPAWREQVPAVHTAPEHFSIEGKSGSMDSWESFSRWYYGLSLNRDKLPAAAHEEIVAHVDTLTTVREKAEALYTYLQGRTRYVSVQLGIGGWQPYDALYVHDRGYGDCKALTNYMYTLLKIAGIPAYPTLIRSGTNVPGIRDDFPSNQFNHVILMVPAETDTLWLETTSQTIPFGHIGAGNQDRYALLVAPEGGKLIRTPKSTAEQNQQIRTATVELASSGNATMDLTTLYTGNQQDRVRGSLAMATPQKRMEWLRNTLDLPNFEVTGADFSSIEAGETTVALPVQLTVPRHAVKAGKRLFLTPNLMEPWTSIPPELEEERTQPITQTYAFKDTDTIQYILPDGYTVEAMPSPVQLETPYGHYHAENSLNQEDGTLTYQRTLALTATEIPPDAYDTYRDFLRQVARADKAQLVLVRK